MNRRGFLGLAGTGLVTGLRPERAADTAARGFDKESDGEGYGRYVEGSPNFTLLQSAAGLTGLLSSRSFPHDEPSDSNSCALSTSTGSGRSPSPLTQGLPSHSCRLSARHTVRHGLHSELAPREALFARAADRRWGCGLVGRPAARRCRSRRAFAEC